MDLNDVRSFLKENLQRDVQACFGVRDAVWLERVTENWFNDEKNYDGRWEVIQKRRSTVGKVLDMASGCGTFVVYGLKKGYDVWGIEPEKWKREYFRMKVEASNYSRKFLSRIISAVGELLPFRSESFDIVTTYQTLEHVKDVSMCLREMLRVLKPEGILYVRAPEYRSLYEGHYRIPFPPIRNRGFCACYLKILGRPISGLQNLQFTTERVLVKYLKNSNYSVNIVRTNQTNLPGAQEKIGRMLPSFLKGNNEWLLTCLTHAASFKRWMMSFKRERNIDLWVTKL